MKKRGQITLFVIIALVIIFLIAFLFLWPSIQSNFISFEPRSYIVDCVTDYVKEGLDAVEERSGSMSPENYMLFNGEKVGYLCYTNEYYKTCSAQKPLLTSHIETEIEIYTNFKARSCFNNLKKELEKRGYEVSMGEHNVDVDLVPDKAEIVVELPLTIYKDSRISYETFRFSSPTKIYNFAMIASSIVNWESRYGDAEVTDYMNYYPNIKVEKLKQSDGSTIYRLTDRETGERFVFASRSVAWPPGYEIDELHQPIR